MDSDSKTKDPWAQTIKDFAYMIEAEQSWWQRFCWGIYSIVFDISRITVLPFVAIGYAIWDAVKAAREEFGNE